MGKVVQLDLKNHEMLDKLIEWHDKRLAKVRKDLNNKNSPLYQNERHYLMVVNEIHRQFDKAVIDINSQEYNKHNGLWDLTI